MITIDTLTGPAELIWDGTSDPASPGWYLRYTARNGQVLDEILTGDDEDGTEELRAATEAREFLAANGLLRRPDGTEAYEQVTECINCQWKADTGLSHDEYVQANRVMAWLCARSDGTVVPPRSPAAEPLFDDNGTVIGYTAGS